MQHTLDLKEFQLLSAAAIYITEISAITLCSMGELLNGAGYFQYLRLLFWANSM